MIAATSRWTGISFFPLAAFFIGLDYRMISRLPIPPPCRREERNLAIFDCIIRHLFSFLFFL